MDFGTKKILASKLRSAQESYRLKQHEYEALHIMAMGNNLERYGFASYNERLEEIFDRQFVILKEIEKLTWYIGELQKLLRGF